jgi:hypothetical protein
MRIRAAKRRDGAQLFLSAEAQPNAPLNVFFVGALRTKVVNHE